jgi:hypothetical protein
MEQVRGGNYEPRLVEVNGVLGSSPIIVLWLHSTSGRPDLYYRPLLSEFGGVSKVEMEKVYAAEEFLAAARELPSVPRYNEAWAINIGSACARASWPEDSNPLDYDQGVAEAGVGSGSAQGGVLGWYVDFAELGRTLAVHSGIRYFVDEATGACRSLPW